MTQPESPFADKILTVRFCLSIIPEVVLELVQDGIDWAKGND